MEIQCQDAVAREILLSLIARKQKLDDCKRKERLAVLLVTGCFLFYAIFLCFVWSVSEQMATEVFLALFFQFSYPFLFFCVLACLYVWMKICRERKKKAEEEFHELRCEIIDRSKDLWQGEGWEQRQRVFVKLKQEYDINLYFESR